MLQIFIKDVFIKENNEIKVNCVFGKVEVKVYKTSETSIHFT
jgi:hypothetical protein